MAALTPILGSCSVTEHPRVWKIEVGGGGKEGCW